MTGPIKRPPIYSPNELTQYEKIKFGPTNNIVLQ